MAEGKSTAADSDPLEGCAAAAPLVNGDATARVVITIASVVVGGTMAAQDGATSGTDEGGIIPALAGRGCAEAEGADDTAPVPCSAITVGATGAEIAVVSGARVVDSSRASGMPVRGPGERTRGVPTSSTSLSDSRGELQTRRNKKTVKIDEGQ